mmetsp:Transcript_73855/g.173414  ORF Transcript_73855/g.173414 Transcript_73855/m.173414 type:complete len:209 (+) Transcript_73855:123-749(+)
MRMHGSWHTNTPDPLAICQTPKPSSSFTRELGRTGGTSSTKRLGRRDATSIISSVTETGGWSTSLGGRNDPAPCWVSTSRLIKSFRISCWNTNLRSGCLDIFGLPRDTMLRAMYKLCACPTTTSWPYITKRHTSFCLTLPTLKKNRGIRARASSRKRPMHCTPTTSSVTTASWWLTLNTVGHRDAVAAIDCGTFCGLRLKTPRPLSDC